MAFYLLATLFAIIFSVVALPVAVLAGRPLAHKLAVVGIRVLLWFCKVCDGISYEITGAEHLPAGPCLVVSEHQSALDTMILFVELRSAIFVLKKELKRLPVIGLWVMMLRMIFIDRSQKVAALKKMIRECGKKSAEGCTVIIFPGGTRDTSDRNGKKYFEGMAAVYQKLRIPVVPVVLNTGNFWPGEIVTLKKRPGKVTVRIMPSIQPGLERDAFMEAFKNSILEGGRLLESSNVSP